MSEQSVRDGLPGLHMRSQSPPQQMLYGDPSPLQSLRSEGSLEGGKVPKTLSIISQSLSIEAPPKPEHCPRKPLELETSEVVLVKSSAQGREPVLLIQTAWRTACQRIELKAKLKTIRNLQAKLVLNKILNRLHYSIRKHKKQNSFYAWQKLVSNEKKQKTLLMFLNYSVVFIQKIWRGYIVRKKMRAFCIESSHSKSVMLAALKGWKTRKIYKSKRFKTQLTIVKDITNLLNDLQEGDSLKGQFAEKLPIAKRKLSAIFLEMYVQGSWAMQQSSPTQARGRETYREDKPIRPLKNNIEELPVASVQPPKQKFVNFLRKGQKSRYPTENSKSRLDSSDTSKLRNNSSERSKLHNNSLEKAKLRNDSSERSKLPNNSSERSKLPNDSSERSKLPNNSPERSKLPNNSPERSKMRSNPPEKSKIRSQSADPKILEEKKDEVNTTMYSFLRRKSRPVQATKLNWNVKSRVDCWINRGSPKPTRKAPLRNPTQKRQDVKQPQPQRKPRKRIDMLKVELLEDMVNALAVRHVDPVSFFLDRDVQNMDSIIPRLGIDSAIVNDFHQSVQELEREYAQLCRASIN